MSVARFPRRSVLLALACAPVAAQWAGASSALTYSLVLRPTRALLGDSIVLTLVCTTAAPTEAVTFEDASLMLQMARMPPGQDPAQVYPNRISAELDGMLVRSAPAGRRSLARDERITREFDVVALFPRWTLDTGIFQLSYRIGTHANSSNHGNTCLTIESGPQAVQALFRQLAHADPGVRARCAGLLHRMTARFLGYAPNAATEERLAAIARWRRWWETSGSNLPWNFSSSGATLGETSLSPSSTGRSSHLGGVAYQRRRLEPQSMNALSSALSEWQRSAMGSAAALHGRVWVADQLFIYPGEEFALDPGEDVSNLMQGALSRLARLAPASTPEATGARMIVSTVARCPDKRFLPSLYKLQTAANGSASWRDTVAIVDGLLDYLDPGRTPVGAASS
jgi:hypothetical protein